MSGPSNRQTQFAAQFTEEQELQMLLECERCRAALHPGVWRRRMGSQFNGPGKMLCRGCYSYYLNKPTTVRQSQVPGGSRPEAGSSSAAPGMQQAPAPNQRLQSVNLSEINSNIKSAWRTPADNQPQHLPRPGSGGPQAIAGYGSSTGPALLPPFAIGYNPQAHEHYYPIRDAVATVAYASDIALTLTVHAEVRRESKNKKGDIVNNLVEGIPKVPAKITYGALRAILIETFRRPLQLYYKGIAVPFDELIIRDREWVNMAQFPPNDMPFWDKYTSASKKKPGERIFKAPTGENTKPLYYVVIPRTAYETLEIKLEQLQLEEAQSNAAERRPISKRTRDPPGVNSTHTSPQAKRVATQSTTSRDNVHDNRPQTPPRRNIVPALPWKSPDRVQLEAALVNNQLNKHKLERIDELVTDTGHFFPIPDRPLKDLLTQKHASPNFVDPTKGVSVSVLRRKAFPKKGGFKTANEGWMTLHPLAGSGFGSAPRTHIMVKRPYHRNPPPALDEDAPAEPAGEASNERDKPAKIYRYSYAEELNLIKMEALLLYWARALMSMTYEFIDSVIFDELEEPPFEIPRLKWVEAGILVLKQSGPKASEIAVLAEEYIEMDDSADLDDDGDFCKYIHNAQAKPVPKEGEEGYAIAEFLCFCQHVMWEKTGHKVFLSDFQGWGNLLTDPQIISDPQLGNLFADGNLQQAFYAFPQQHDCNEMCRWFKLKRP